MNSNVDRLIDNLTPAIEEKCEELRASKRQKIGCRIFIFLCAAAILLPVAAVFVGVSLTVFVALPIFMSFCMLFLLPVLISPKNSEGGAIYEQA